MKQVCRDQQPVIITRQRAESVVMLSIREFESLEETAHLLRSPANARRSLEAIARLDAGQAQVRERIDDPGLQ
ncbi:MAG: type II toxin-antitoxin system prevent-host-death family antitoxin [Armatimonadetes bacterium]|nr:type II toxin-antitoxin system prevent-host-death family antitoxin [Armatimonadota bacterium]